MPDGLKTTAGLKIMCVISNHTALKLQRNYMYFHGKVVYFHSESDKERKGHEVIKIERVYPFGSMKML